MIMNINEVSRTAGVLESNIDGDLADVGRNPDRGVFHESRRRHCHG